MTYKNISSLLPLLNFFWFHSCSTTLIQQIFWFPDTARHWFIVFKYKKKDLPFIFLLCAPSLSVQHLLLLLCRFLFWVVAIFQLTTILIDFPPAWEFIITLLIYITFWVFFCFAHRHEWLKRSSKCVYPLKLRVFFFATDTFFAFHWHIRIIFLSFFKIKSDELRLNGQFLLLLLLPLLYHRLNRKSMYVCWVLWVAESCSFEGQHRRITAKCVVWNWLERWSPRSSVPVRQ